MKKVGNVHFVYSWNKIHECFEFKVSHQHMQHWFYQWADIDQGTALYDLPYIRLPWAVTENLLILYA